jgi:methyl-accepting chemotaxis protein
MLKRPTISAKLLASLLTVMVINLAAALFAYDRLGFIRESNALSSESYETMLGLQDLLSTVVAQCTAVDRYLSSADKDALVPFTTGKDAFDRRLELVRAFKVADAEHRNRLDGIGKSLDEWRAAAGTDVRLMVASDEANSKLSALLKATEEMVEAERSRIAERAQAESDAFDTASFVNLAGPGVALFAAFAVGMLLVRAISRPIRTLTAAMRELAEGKLNTGIPETERLDEIGAMGRVLGVFKENMLRNCGVEVGKRDFMGTPVML